jgi:anti-sigma factor RsiW
MRVFLKSGHASDASLGLFAVGDLPKSKAAALEKHLSDCRRCQSEMEETKAFVSAFRILARQLGSQAASATARI